jgi:hypothetical protein
MQSTRTDTSVQFSAFILLGPTIEDQNRILDFLESLCTYEPMVSEIVIADDTADGFRLRSDFHLPVGCRLSVLKNPVSRRNYNSLCVNTLMGMHYCFEAGPIDFVVKFDTDALVIAPFSAKISKMLNSNPDAGIVGLLADSCNRAHAHYRAHADLRDILELTGNAVMKLGGDVEGLQNWLKLWPRARSGSTVVGLKRFVERFSPLRQAGFSGEHCNGGAYVVSNELLIRMNTLGAFEDYNLWTAFPFSEDRMMGLYRALSGLRVLDYSGRDEPFGTRASGLAFSPQELLDFGHSIIHSVKNDEHWSEADIRAFFKCRRSGAGGIGHVDQDDQSTH